MAATCFINAHRVFAFSFHCIVLYPALYSHDFYYSSNARNLVIWKGRNHADWPIPFQLITSIDRSRLAPKSESFFTVDCLLGQNMGTCA